ncbi:Aldo/keto reductase [Panus rudis PR-1116 ss-1]|nr:Aldo/keto reductase [Panus rudis PR-1116 ss-1]
MTIPKFKLNNGVEIPAIGLGGWAGLTAEERSAAGKSWMLTAIKNGYRHIDTAQVYGTEPAVAEAIKLSGIPREEFFITTKLPWNHPSRVKESFEQSLKNLQTDYVDLYLMHWPFTVRYDENNELPRNAQGDLDVVEKPDFNETWAEMEKIYASGKAKAIGVSNFSIKTLEKLFQTAKVVPAVNQVELHPYLAQPELKKYCDEKGIVLTAYTPTGYSNVLSDPTITSLAQKYNATPAQIVLSWHVARGVVAVPKSSNPEHQKHNLELVKLSDEDVAKITALDRNERLCNKPNERGIVWGWTMEQLGW